MTLDRFIPAAMVGAAVFGGCAGAWGMDLAVRVVAILFAYVAGIMAERAYQRQKVKP